ncbi:MAG: tryptophan 7-halogenase [Planctomycetota bacterium]
MSVRFDVAVVGSGFAGSLLATIFSRNGLRVALIDRDRHPRFAVGESSTPLADRLLDLLGRKYGEVSWRQLSTYGTWKRHHADLACGMKRGFSYYSHERGKPFPIKRMHERSLLITASRSVEQSDTHWYRSDVDLFLHTQAIASGAVDFSGWALVGLASRDTRKSIRLELQSAEGGHDTITAEWCVDASGRAAIGAKLLGKPDRVDRLRTNTHSLVTHVHGLPSWTDGLRNRGWDDSDAPFDGDDAAVHHLVDEGWIWNLRFDNGITSIGHTSARPIPLQRSFSHLVAGYPDLAGALEKTQALFDPIRSGRLQRAFDPILMDRVWMLPTAATTLDPLHSTGIALGIAGVHRIADWILDGSNSGVDASTYRAVLWAEVELLDLLISTAYATMGDFERFGAACQLFMLAAITSEEQLISGGFESTRALYGAGHSSLVAVVRDGCQRLLRSGNTPTVIAELRKLVKPFNSVGLFDPDAKNYYAYTATKSA